MKQFKILLLSSLLMLVTATASMGNTAPVADAGEDQIVTTSSKVKLDGSASYDTDSDKLLYSWNFLSQPEGSTATLSKTTGAKTKFIADVDGLYVVKLIVNDGTVDSILDTVTIQAGTITSPLPANITIDNATLQKAIGSITDSTPWAIDVQGIIDTSGLNVIVPYTVVNTPVTLPAYSTIFTIDSAHTEDDEPGIIATFAWTEQISLPVGSGTFTATITIDDSGAAIPDGKYNAKKLDIQDDIAGVVAATFPYPTDNTGGVGTLTLKIYPGIPDRMFGTVDNNGDANSHMFLYLPVTNPATGETWLSNNLGANYANINSPVFNIEQQATASNDYNAYGSLFQWGRKADGHEFINWYSGSIGQGVYGTTWTNSNNPTDTLFITQGSTPYDWRVTQDDTLWESESSTNNVCPIGYRVPTANIGGELDLERQSWSSNNAAGALASTLAMSLPGLRYGYNGNIVDEGGSIYNEGILSWYWGSTVNSSESAQYLHIGINTSEMGGSNRTYGFTVRCIKD